MIHNLKTIIIPVFLFIPATCYSNPHDWREARYDTLIHTVFGVLCFILLVWFGCWMFRGILEERKKRNANGEEIEKLEPGDLFAEMFVYSLGSIVISLPIWAAFKLIGGSSVSFGLWPILAVICFGAIVYIKKT